jgi:protein XagA
MKNHLKILIISGLSILLPPSVSNAQAWTKSKGHGFYKLDFSTIQATDVFNSTGDVVPFHPLNNNISSFYGEYGLTDKLTVLGYVPFYVRNVQKAHNSLPMMSNSNFGDVDLGFRYALPIKKVAVAANLLLGIPTGNSTQKNELYTGDGEFNQLLKLAVGSGGKRWWTQGALGFNNRTKNFSDELRYDFEFGYKFLNDRLLAILKINGVESLNNGTVKAASTGLFSNNVEYLGISPEFLYYVNSKKTIGITGRAGFAAKGQNVLAAPMFSIGIFAEL